MRSRVRGITEFRRMLRAMPEAARREILFALEDVGDELLTFQRALSPYRTGRLQRSMSAKVLETSLKLKVGLVDKRASRAAFYGHILNAGRKPQVKAVTRRRGGKIQRYAMNISAIAPMKFLLTPEEVSYRIAPRMGEVWRNVLFDTANRTGVKDPA